MTTDSIRSLPVIKDESTTAGNYFVSNYPPFSFWSPEQVPQCRQILTQPPQDNIPLGLYVHIPFCRKRCHFCYFKVYTDKNSAEIKTYNQALISELALYTQLPFIGERKLNFVYFGGGTPSYLSAPQLTTLTNSLQALLSWEAVEEVTFECEPGTLTEAKLQAIREMGVTRLSLGVENFNDTILEINGRAHRAAEIEKTYAFARKIGFPQINIDLIAGMIGETEENWRFCLQRTLELDPESVTIYQMEIPFNTTIYKRMKSEGQVTAPVADWETKRRWVGEAFACLENAGYTIGSAYTAVRNPQKTSFVYRDQLWRGADLLALGVASFSHIQGAHFQNEKDFSTYIDLLEKNTLPIHRAYLLTEEERMIRELILQLKLGKVEISYFRDKFAVDILTRFQETFEKLSNEGWLKLTNTTVVLERKGLLQVDQLLSSFFLPRHRDARYT
jgi:oxygen-independent coproporphyrinogen-3 oxidase